MDNAYYDAGAAPSDGHEKALKRTLEGIEDAVQRLLLTRKSYDRAVVLALRWFNEDKGLAPLQTELLNLFSQKFHYDTESIIIPSTSILESRSIRAKVADVIKKYDTPRALVVIVCGGHVAWTGQFFSFSGALGGDFRERTAWDSVKSPVEAAKHCDVLVIVDSCEGTTPGCVVNCGGACESLSALSTKMLGVANLDFGFTRRLIGLLKVVPPDGLTVAQLHAKLFTGAKNQLTSLGYTPTYFSHSRKPSILLHPLHKGLQQVPLKQNPEVDGQKVLCYIQLESKPTLPDINNRWRNWLKAHIPKDILIELEGVFDGDSSLYLLTVPLEVWNILQFTGPYKFVAYVQSSNILDTNPTRPAVSSFEHGPLSLRERATSTWKY
ncbi:uncharacterized protein LDX57_009984 [Aspergillus melleus]|uniref:uncharacterized protein n=1 Tax=Aspergillus melleus TaxID=138277 RepID=UPI001E8D374E|nr:uncharacterized protein LDX57_009984 [Aspergillus melleus]KAH8432346.1 hypothetical protein LDX57_009984 [Aspergillus melleus]